MLHEQANAFTFERFASEIILNQLLKIVMQCFLNVPRKALTLGLVMTWHLEAVPKNPQQNCDCFATSNNNQFIS